MNDILNEALFTARVEKLVNAGQLNELTSLEILNLRKIGNTPAAEAKLSSYEALAFGRQQYKDKEKKLQNELIEISDELQKTHNNNTELEKKLDEIHNKSKYLEAENAALSNTINGTNSLYEKTLSSNKDLKEKIISLEKENNELKAQNQQSRIDKNISGYVESVKNKLNSDDDFFIKMSHIWSGCGALFCIGAIAAAFFTFISGIDTLLKNEELNSVSIFYLFTRGLLGIGLLSWLSYICFSNSRRYTHESIRRKDRQHALMFGQIFLQIFGGTASKEDAIHVFKDWNMSGDTAFSGKTEQPPSVYGLLTQIKNILTKKSDNVSENTKKEDDN